MLGLRVGVRVRVRELKIRVRVGAVVDRVVAYLEVGLGVGLGLGLGLGLLRLVYLEVVRWRDLVFGEIVYLDEVIGEHGDLRTRAGQPRGGEEVHGHAQP